MVQQEGWAPGGSAGMGRVLQSSRSSLMGGRRARASGVSLVVGQQGKVQMWAVRQTACPESQGTLTAPPILATSLAPAVSPWDCKDFQSSNSLS
jgi:hypothetical protein